MPIESRVEITNETGYFQLVSVEAKSSFQFVWILSQNGGYLEFIVKFLNWLYFKLKGTTRHTVTFKRFNRFLSSLSESFSSIVLFPLSHRLYLYVYGFICGFNTLFLFYFAGTTISVLSEEGALSSRIFAFHDLLFKEGGYPLGKLRPIEDDRHVQRAKLLNPYL